MLGWRNVLRDGPWLLGSTAEALALARSFDPALMRAVGTENSRIVTRIIGCHANLQGRLRLVQTTS
jgi:hypothetical protein